jgi:LysM repeat protein
VPRPYLPPVSRRDQAVSSARTSLLKRWWWVVPLGLLPVFALVALASAGQFERPSGQAVASGPVEITSAGPAATTAKPGTTSAAQTTTAQTSPAETTSAAAPASQGAADNTQNPAGTLGGTGTQAVAGTPGGATTGTQSAAVGTQGGAPPSPTGQTALPGTATSNATTAPATGPTPAGATIQASGPFKAYSVKPGDTVAFVAQLYGVSPASVAQASGLPNADRIRVGQVLTIPNQPGYLYRMQPGETLDQISARTGVRSDVIASASMLGSVTAKSGDVILIPDMAWTAGK